MSRNLCMKRDGHCEYSDQNGYCMKPSCIRPMFIPVYNGIEPKHTYLTEPTNNMEKVYEVTFIEYTNEPKLSVTDGEGYIIFESCGPFLVKESELEKYKTFGKGFRDIRFVGYMKC